MRRRFVLAVLGLLASWLVAGVVTAAPASAHALLESTSPENGAQLATAPDRVTLTFSESVSLRAGYVHVVDARGARADAGQASVSGPTVTVPLRPSLPQGGYLVTYRVISDDSHPVGGSISFVVGQGSLVAPGTVSAAGATDPVVDAALPVARWLTFAGLALALGIPVLLALCWPGGWAVARLRRMTAWGAAGVVVGTAATFLLQGPYAGGVGVGSLFDSSLLSDTTDSRFGQVLLIRLVLALGYAAVLLPAWRLGLTPSRLHLAASAVLGLGVVNATAAVGHPIAGSWPGLAVLVATVHVAGMAIWLGGLAGLLAGVLRPGDSIDTLAATLPRFSRLAFTSVAALVVTGVVQAVREVGSLSALTTTAYGRVLLAKLVLVLVILAAAGVSRVWVQQRLATGRPRRGSVRRVGAPAFAGEEDAVLGEPDEPIRAAAAGRVAVQTRAAAEDLPAFRRSVLVEFVVGVVVLALSAVLVGSNPANAVVSQPLDVTLPLTGSAGPKGSVQISVGPGRPGPNTLHLYLFDQQGQLIQPRQITVSLTEPQQQIGPIDVKLQPGGPGHYLADAMTIPAPGTWTIAVNLRLDEFTAVTASTRFPVR